MTITGSYEDLFRKEISKYDHICEEIAQNIEAQEQLLFQIQVCFVIHHNGSRMSLRHFYLLENSIFQLYYLVYYVNASYLLFTLTGTSF